MANGLIEGIPHSITSYNEKDIGALLNGNIYNVMAYGATGTGIDDDTAAIQAAFDAAITAGYPITTARYAKGIVYFPVGTYRITKPIEVTGVIGLHVMGESQWMTIIAPSGTQDSAFDLNGLAYCTFERFSVVPASGAAVDKGIYLYWGGTGETIRTTFLNSFRNVNVAIGFGGSFRAGFSIGSNNNSLQCDGTSFYDCHVEGSWTTGNTTTYQAAFELGPPAGTTGNYNVNHCFYNCGSLTVRYFIHAEKVNYHVYGAELEQGEVCFKGATWQNTSIYDISVEQFERFMVSINPTNLVQQLTVSGVVFRADNVNADGIWMDIKENGCINLTDLKAYWVTATVPLIVRIDTNTGLYVTIEGLQQTTPYATGLVITSPSLTGVSIRGYVEINTDQEIVALTSVTLPKTIMGATGGSIGFYGTTPGAKPTITGSKGANAALTSLLSALATLGLVTDSTS